MILRKILIFLFISQFLYADERHTQFVLESYNDCKTEIDTIDFFANIENNPELPGQFILALTKKCVQIVKSYGENMHLFSQINTM